MAGAGRHRPGRPGAVYPYGAITRGEKGAELADMPAMEPFVCGFSDDGKGVQSADQMRDAMELAKQLDKPITAHCEDESLLTPGWCIHDGSGRSGTASPATPLRASGNRWSGIWSWCGDRLPVPRVPCLHQGERGPHPQGQGGGAPVSCETGPHYLILCDEDLMDDGRFKMNPPSAPPRTGML